MRGVVVPPVLLLLAAGALAPSASAAARESCGAATATMVGTPQGQISGTEGPDVIVTNGATRTDAKGGDEVICTTDSIAMDPGAPAGVYVYAGPGDVFYGGRQSDTVRMVQDGAHDFARVGFGDDFVSLEESLADAVNTGWPTTP